MKKMEMKNMLLPVLYIILASCANPAIEMPEIEEHVPETAENVPVNMVMSIIPDFEDILSSMPPMPEEVAEEYSILGSWQREFDGHTEVYEFTEIELITYADGSQNGKYPVTYEEDYWAFSIGETRLEYELVENEVLILAGYQYWRVE